MKLHHHRRSRRIRRAAAALLTCALSLLVAPVALAEPLEGDRPNQHDAAPQPSVAGLADTEWPQSRLQDLVGQEADERADENGSYRAQQEAYLSYLEQKAAAVKADQPADQTSGEGSGQSWLIGAGAIVIAAIASIGAAIGRSRRQEPVLPIQQDRDRVNA